MNEDRNQITPRAVLAKHTDSKQCSTVRESVSRVHPINSIGSLLRYPDLTKEINGLSPYLPNKDNILVSNFTPSNFKGSHKEGPPLRGNESMATGDLKAMFSSSEQEKGARGHLSAA